jgi:hypothetical protein
MASYGRNFLFSTEICLFTGCHLVKTAEMAIVTSPVLVLIFQALVSMVTAQNPGKYTMHFYDRCSQGSRNTLATARG